MRVITGYPGGNEIGLAMERGEVQGRCGWSWSSVKSTHQKWLDDKRFNILVQLALEKHPELPNVPLITDLAQNDEQRQILRLIFARQVMGRPFVAPPNVPRDRAEALRKAFMDTMNDKDFLADAEKAQMEITPVPGDQIEKLVKDIYATPAAVAQKAGALLKVSRPQGSKFPMDANTKNYAGWQSDVIVDLIKRYNFPYITMNPGASFRGLHDSLVNYGNNEPPMLLCQHEEIAVQIAHGYAKASGKPMAVILHNLVGLLHATMAIYYAYIDRVPIFIMGATGPMDEGKRRPHIDWTHTALVQGNAIRDYIKWDYQPTSIDGVPESFARAYSIMTTEPQGPVYMCYDAGLQETPLAEPVPLPPVHAVVTPVAAACRIRRRCKPSPTSCSRPSIPCCSRNTPAAAPAASRASSSWRRPSAARSGTSTTRSTSRTSIRCASRWTRSRSSTPT